MPKDHVRILLVGDVKVGKSTLISSYISRQFSEEVPSLMTDAVLPPDTTANNVAVSISDSSAYMCDRDLLRKKIRLADCIMVLYDMTRTDTLVSIERTWLPLLRDTCSQDRESNEDEKVILIVGTKRDLLVVDGHGDYRLQEQEERLKRLFLDHSTLIPQHTALSPVGCPSTSVSSGAVGYATHLPVMACYQCSAKYMDADQIFFEGELAVSFPIAPLFNVTTNEFTTACIRAFAHIFRIFDINQDGLLDDKDLLALQLKCFDVPMPDEEIAALKREIRLTVAGGVKHNSVTFVGFLTMMSMFIYRSQQQIPWTVLNRFGYDDNLRLILPTDVIDSQLAHSTNRSDMEAAILLPSSPPSSFSSTAASSSTKSSPLFSSPPPPASSSIATLASNKGSDKNNTNSLSPLLSATALAPAPALVSVPIRPPRKELTQLSPEALEFLWNLGLRARMRKALEIPLHNSPGTGAGPSPGSDAVSTPLPINAPALSSSSPASSSPPLPKEVSGLSMINNQPPHTQTSPFPHLTRDDLERIFSVMAPGGRHPWNHPPPAFIDNEDDQCTHWYFLSGMHPRLHSGESSCGDGQREDDGGSQYCCSLEAWISQWQMLALYRPSLTQGLLYQLGYVERSDDIGVVTIPHPLHLLPLPTISTKTRASSRTKTRASTHGGLVLHVCVLGAVGVDTGGLVQALSNLSTTVGSELGPVAFPPREVSDGGCAVNRDGNNSGDDGATAGAGVVGNVNSGGNGIATVSDSEIGVKFDKHNHIDNNADVGTTYKSTGDVCGSLMAIVHSSCPWQIAHEPGQGQGKGLNQGQDKGLAEGSSHLPLVSAEPFLTGDKSQGIHHQAVHAPLVTVVVTAVPMHQARTWLAMHAHILDVVVLVVDDDQLDHRNNNKSGSTISGSSSASSASSASSSDFSKKEGNTTIEIAMQLEQYVPLSLPRLFVMATDHPINHHQSHDPIESNRFESTVVNKLQNVREISQEQRLDRRMGGKDNGVEMVNMGGRCGGTLQDLQSHISNHVLPELQYVSTAAGEEDRLVGLMNTLVHVATHPDVGIPIAFLRQREQRRRTIFYAVSGVSLVTLAIAGYVAMTTSTTTTSTTSNHASKGETRSLSTLLTSFRTSLSATLSSVSSSLGW